MFISSYYYALQSIPNLSKCDLMYVCVCRIMNSYRFNFVKIKIQ